MRLAADELVALLDGHHALDRLGELRAEGVQVGVGEFVANRANDRAGHAAHDVWFVAEFADFLQDSALVLPGDARFQNNDHVFFLGWPRKNATKKPQVA